MARVTVVKAARKPQGRCEKCGTELGVGSSYKWCAPRAGKFTKGFKRKRCLNCPHWRPSETTSSSARSSVYAAQEAAEDALRVWGREDVGDLQAILSDAAEGVREGAQAYEESAQNMEDGFGHATSMSEELQEKAQTLNDAADELENIDLEDFNEDDVREEYRTEAEESIREEMAGELENNSTVEWTGEDITNHPEFDAAEFERRVDDYLDDKVNEAREEWADEQEGIVSDAIGNIEIP